MPVYVCVRVSVSMHMCTGPSKGGRAGGRGAFPGASGAAMGPILGPGAVKSLPGKQGNGRAAVGGVTACCVVCSVVSCRVVSCRGVCIFLPAVVSAAD